MEGKAFLTLVNHCHEFETNYKETKELYLLVVKSMTSNDEEKNEIAVLDAVNPLLEEFAGIKSEEIFEDSP